jgi:cyclic pyranopterin phosphate synthase
MEKVVSRREILDRLTRRYGQIEPLMSGGDPVAPAERFRVSDGTTFGIIASTTQPFCRSCDRSRLTADGHFLLASMPAREWTWREPLRSGATDEEIRSRSCRPGRNATTVVPRSGAEFHIAGTVFVDEPSV